MGDASLLVALTGMVFLVLGIFQFAKGVVERADAKRQELFTENENIRRQLLEVQAELELLKEKCTERSEYIVKLTAYAKKIKRTNELLSEQIKDYQGTRD